MFYLFLSIDCIIRVVTELLNTSICPRIFLSIYVELFGVNWHGVGLNIIYCIVMITWGDLRYLTQLNLLYG